MEKIEKPEIKKIVEEQLRLRPDDHAGQKKLFEKIKKLREEEKKNGRT